ncbi:DUF4232 domain-containing protein [Amycolatopsis azurea]|uniref:Putative lipoprotein n=1 Tax=Amycolatopsis azurea DSM 43854 TaxID=1238180 RepID=M2QNF7_9PSEU|nr:DUF4232 domain-containing protein [Amycolatopsis azurea]EMD28221.1 putative lipoprotein [Amycolatopsis azurea DSM 43854]OOC00741.1 hypothetical protein B0293_41170 [Amycolatopsis azurea DSM 43854]
MSGKQIKRVSLGVAVLTGALALTAASTAEAATTRCGTGDLAVSLGEPKQLEEATGQYDVPLTFKNISSKTCGLHGVPGVDLAGPDDPNGPVYHLPRVDNGVRVNEVPPGSTATATVTVLSSTEGSVGSGGSTSWTPSKLVTIPPGETEALSVDWPSGLPVLRQDAATRPGSWVNGILADPTAS